MPVTTNYNFLLSVDQMCKGWGTLRIMMKSTAGMLEGFCARMPSWWMSGVTWQFDYSSGLFSLVSLDITNNLALFFVSRPILALALGVSRVKLWTHIPILTPFRTKSQSKKAVWNVDTLKASPCSFLLTAEYCPGASWPGGYPLFQVISSVQLLARLKAAFI